MHVTNQKHELRQRSAAVIVKPLAKPSVDNGNTVTGDHIFGDCREQPCRSDENYYADSELQPQKASTRETRP